MEHPTRLSFAIALALMITASFAQAQESHSEKMHPGDMMEHHGMMGDGDMSGMMGMMQMMGQMGPMMEACTEMMQAMNDKPDTEKPTQLGG